jgi:N-acetylglucosamine-6-phosphate deacetylase
LTTPRGGRYDADMADDLLFIHGGDVITPHEVLRGADILVRGHRIARIGRKLARPAKARVIDARKGFVAPGLIDVQVNGAAGVAFNTCRPEQVPLVARALAARGVTGYCATLISSPHDRMVAAIRAIAAETEAGGGDGAGNGRPGARNLGLHLEGPYLSPERHGAHRSECLREPGRHELAECLAAARGRVAIVTLAPELPGALDAIRFLTGKGVCVAAGHTMATLTEVESAMEQGLRMATHLYNAMRPAHHRSPGVVEASLTLDALAVGLIADGVHVHPAAVDVVLRCKPPEQVVLVSDIVSVAGASGGTATLDGRSVEARDGAAWLAGTTTLSGASAFLLEGVCNLVAWFDLPLPRAFCTASLNPARLLGVARRKGSLDAGKDADVIVLDRDLKLKATVVEGAVAFEAR